MELSPWTIYLVMKCDSVVGVFSVMAAAFIVLLCFVAMISLIAKLEDEDEGKRLYVAAIAKKLAMVALISLIACCLFPDSKTVASMLILPKIVNNEAVSEEAKELYALAKQAMVGAAQDTIEKTTKGKGE